MLGNPCRFKISTYFCSLMILTGCQLYNSGFLICGVSTAVIFYMCVAALLVPRGVLLLRYTFLQPSFWSMPLLLYCLITRPCFCVLGVPLPFSTTHPKSKAAISKSEIDSVHFGFLYVLNNDFTSRLYSCLHIIGSRSYVTSIHTPPQCYPDTSMNAMYV